MENIRRSSRRNFVKLAAAGVVLARVPLVFGAASQKAVPKLDPDEILRELLAGNVRFSKGEAQNPRRTPADFRPLAQGQHPKAIVVSCADSRVAPELLFDVGIGEIFVVRVAGNVIADAGAPVVGSIEYGVAELNVPLLFVLGHSACGAVKAAKEHYESKESSPGAIDGLVELIKPAVAQSKGMPGDPLQNAIIRHVQIGVERAETLNPILGPRVKEGKLKVVGGVYDLATGLVSLTPKEAAHA